MNIFVKPDSDLQIFDNTVMLEAETKDSYIKRRMGDIKDFEFFAAIYRQQIFFQYVKTGNAVKDIPLETQWLLIKHKNGEYTIIVPMAEEPFRCALCGGEDGLYIYCETGDPAIIENKGLAAYYITGTNPYEMMKRAGKDISKILPDCRTREEKFTPEFVNYFGWCTWDSFYDKVTAEDIKIGLQSFKKGGIIPGLVILDDGWQTVEPVDDNRGHHQLSSFKANGKFNHSLAETVSMAKNEFGVKLFMVWHAVMGYWGGVYPNSEEMSEFDVKLKTQNHSDTMFKVNPQYSESLQFPYGFVNPKKAFAFYNEYHSRLRKEGVDGVKVDVQAALEGAGYGEGGRVKTIKNFRKGLEASVNMNFKGNLINCMSCSNDHILNTLSTNVMRSSDDFFPAKPKSHGVHIFRNAFNSIFMGEFLICDWDMFQTKHEYGEFHAASRAISGSPVYVSDKVEEHDFSVIDKLTMSDSRLPLCTMNARPTLDSLFIDSENMNDLFKIFNYNKYTGVIGTFNLTDDRKLSKSVSPSDIDGFKEGEYAVYSYKNESLIKYAAKDNFGCDIDAIGFDIFTVSSIENGFAPIGLVNKYNSGGTILSFVKNESVYDLTVGDAGRFTAYCEKKPKKVTVNGKDSDFIHSENRLLITVNEKSDNRICIYF